MQANGFGVLAVGRTLPKRLPSDVQVMQVDLSNVDELKKAFKDQDAVVEAFNPLAASQQDCIIEAAIQAGIRHVITPEFAGDTFAPHVDELKIYEPKRRAHKALLEKVSGTNLKWTAIIAGPWYDWGMYKRI